MKIYCALLISVGSINLKFGIHRLSPVIQPANYFFIFQTSRCFFFSEKFPGDIEHDAVFNFDCS
jgi:hypothetical protein